MDGRSSFQTEVHKSKHIFTTVPNQKHFFRHLITLEFINLWSCLSYNLHKYFWLWHHHVRLWQMITDQELSSLCDRYLPCQSHLSLDGCCANLLPSMIESFTSICQLIYASDPDNSVLLGCQSQVWKTIFHGSGGTKAPPWSACVMWLDGTKASIYIKCAAPFDLGLIRQLDKEWIAQ